MNVQKETFSKHTYIHNCFTTFQMTSQKDYILHMAETPDPVEDEVSDVEQEVPASKKSTVKPGTLEEMNNQWLATHAKQVIIFTFSH